MLSFQLFCAILALPQSDAVRRGLVDKATVSCEGDFVQDIQAEVVRGLGVGATAPGLGESYSAEWQAGTEGAGIVKLVEMVKDTAETCAYEWQARLDELPLNRLPMVGSHDSATGSRLDLNHSYWSWSNFAPFVYTQSSNFEEQFDSGARVFDLRIKQGSRGLRFFHGPIDLGAVADATDFFNMLVRAVKTKTVVVLKAKSHSRFNPKRTSVAWADDLTSVIMNKIHKDNTTDPNPIVQVAKSSELKTTVKTFKRHGKFIILLASPKKGTFVTGSAHLTTACFKGMKSCLSSEKRSADFFSRIEANLNRARDHGAENSDNIQQLSAHFQAPSGKGAQLLRTFTSGSGKMAIKVEEEFGTNQRVGYFFLTHLAQHLPTPGVVMVDNVKADTCLRLQRILELYALINQDIYPGVQTNSSISIPSP